VTDGHAGGSPGTAPDRSARGLRVLAAILAVWLAGAGCASTGARVPDPEEERRAALLEDALYHVQNVPPEFPAQRAASFRVAAQGYQAWKQGRLQEAEDRLENSLTLDPRNPFGYLYLAEIRMQEGAFPQALIFLNQAEVLFQGHPYWLSEVHGARGRCYEQLGQQEEAAGAYARSLEFNPWNETSRESLKRVGPPRG